MINNLTSKKMHPGNVTQDDALSSYSGFLPSAEKNSLICADLRKILNNKTCVMQADVILHDFLWCYRALTPETLFLFE